MRNNIKFLVVGIFVAAIALLVGVVRVPQAEAAPAAVSYVAPNVYAVFFQHQDAVTETTLLSSRANIAQFDAGEVQYVIDVTGTVTVTLNLQESNDRVVWRTTTVVTDVTADENGFLTPALVGQFARFQLVQTGTGSSQTDVNAVLEN